MEQTNSTATTQSRWMWGGLVAIVVFVTVAGFWLRLEDPASHAGSAEEVREREQATTLRRAQALAVNEPTAANVRAWESSTRAYRAQRWGRALVSAHVTADDAIDANNLDAARTALTSALVIEAPPPARQDLLQRLAWVELNLGLMNDAREHADQALAMALDADDPSGRSNSLVVRHMIATRAGNQAKVDELTELLLEALAPR